MINLFSVKDNTAYTNRSASQFQNFNGVLEYNIKKFKGYYYSYEGRVDNRHMLVRMIKQFPMSSTVTMSDLLSFYNVYKQTVVRHFQIISHLSRDKATGNIFSMSLVDDIFFITPDNYKSVRTIKVLQSDDYISGLELTHIRNKETEDIIGLDILGMLQQYFYWRNDRRLYGASIDPSIFVYQIMNTNLAVDKLPFSMYKTFMDYIVYEIPLPLNLKNRNPIDLKSYNNYYYRYMEYLYKDINKSKGRLMLIEILKWVRLPIYGDAYQLLLRDFDFININNRTFIYLIELPELFTLVTLVGGIDKAKRNNRHLRIDLNQAKRDIAGSRVMPKSEYFKWVLGTYLPIIKKNY